MEYFEFDEQFLQHKKEKNGSFFIFFCAILFILLLVNVTDLLFNLKYGYVVVENVSMQPTLNPSPLEDDRQDAVFIERTQKLSYGDIVIVDRSEERPGYSVIKRVVAFSGDKISLVMLPVGEGGAMEMRLIRIKEGDSTRQIVYTGQDDEYVIYESYIKSYDEWNGLGLSESGYSYSEDNFAQGVCYYDVGFLENFINKYPTEIIPVTAGGMTYQVRFFTVGSDLDEQALFCMGDNRAESKDSRDTGSAKLNKVIGKVISIIRNAMAHENDFFNWAKVLGEYLRLIFKEIIAYFTP